MGIVAAAYSGKGRWRNRLSAGHSNTRCVLRIDLERHSAIFVAVRPSPTAFFYAPAEDVIQRRPRGHHGLQRFFPSWR
jgi:hypothetical protein